MGHQRSSQKSKIQRNRQGRTRIDNCGTGYYNQTRSFRQIHHIVCISSMSNATIKDLISDKGQMEFIRECLKLTNWDINDEPNTVGLPLKRAFVKKEPAGWNGWPCHQVDHNPYYTDGVSVRLKKKVWLKVLKKRKQCTTCNTKCNINAASVEKQLNAESKHWRTFLTRRGRSKLGTAYCWKKRHSVPDVWYIPFSMHPAKPPRRDPPPDWDSLTETLKEYLSGIFAKCV